ncbi:hypothetical protein AWB72_05423 [Caballeronia concitans]|uniref:Uncharacterized protein n=2 Tax=Caballeronia concitans TaxID=1777133 RepID=A0A658R5Q8_9BURK|nr:hypothetical protein AWB72_05423 [Caballeronia concitans]
MLTAHRDDIFKIGYYINVFFEERFSGPAWHIRLAHLRYMGESQDPAVYVAWTLFSFNSILFVISIFIWTKEVSPHALVIVPVFFVMLWQSKQFLKNRDYIKDAWIDVRNNEG